MRVLHGISRIFFECGDEERCNDGGEDFLLGGSSIGSWEVRSRILVIEKDFIFLILRGAYIRNFNLIF